MTDVDLPPRPPEESVDPVARDGRARVPTAATTARPRPLETVVASGALAGWLLLVFGSRWWAESLTAQGHQLILFTPPVLGGDRFDGYGRFWIPAVTAVILVGGLPPLARRLRWPAVLVLTAVSSLAWWVALASIDGARGIVGGLAWDAEFAVAAPRVAAAPGPYLSGFVANLPNEGIYLRSHPPGVPLVMGGLHRLGLAGPWWAAACILLVAALGVVAVLVTVREIAGEQWARRALPFVVLAPCATWIATSFDALFIGVASWFVALLAMACTRTGRRRDLLAVGAGLLATAAILLSYGLVLLACSAVLVAVTTRRARPLVIASIVGLGSTAALLLTGFNWLAGLWGTSEQYFGFGLDRPYSYFVVGNLGAWALALGPATFVALTRLRDKRMWCVVGGGLAAALLADISGMSNGEVERIWLPFTVWVVAAGAALSTTMRATRGWLTVQIGSALGLAWFISPLW